MLLLLLYLSLDLGSPWVPGAFVFNPDESVDGVSIRRPAQVRAATALTRSMRLEEPSKLVSGVSTRPELRTPLDGWLAELRQAHSASHETAPPTDDH